MPDSLQLTTTWLYTVHNHLALYSSQPCLTLYSSQPPDSIQLTTTWIYTAHNHLTLYSSNSPIQLTTMPDSIQLTTTWLYTASTWLYSSQPCLTQYSSQPPDSTAQIHLYGSHQQLTIYSSQPPGSTQLTLNTRLKSFWLCTAHNYLDVYSTAHNPSSTQVRSYHSDFKQLTTTWLRKAHNHQALSCISFSPKLTGSITNGQ